jgi:hypothetical protein
MLVRSQRNNLARRCSGLRSRPRLLPALLALPMLALPLLGSDGARPEADDTKAANSPKIGEEGTPSTIRLDQDDLPADRYPIQWRGDWPRAREEARIRNVPILLVIHRDGELFSRAARSSLWIDREFIGLVDDECVPVLIVSPPAEGEPHRELPGRERSGVGPLCPIAGTLPCAAHEHLARQIPESLLGESGRYPLRRLVAPTGEVLCGPSELPPGIDAGRFKDAIRRAREHLPGPALTRIQYRFALARLSRIAAGLAEREFRSPALELVTFRREQENLPSELLAEADRLEGILREEAGRMLEKARLVEAQRGEIALQIYHRIHQEFPGTPEAAIAQAKITSGRPADR